MAPRAPSDVIALPIAPARTGATITLPASSILAVERSLAGTSWVVHARDLPTFAVRQSAALGALVKSEAFLDLPAGRSVRAAALGGAFFASPRKGAVRLLVLDCRQPFDLFGEGPELEKAYEKVRRAASAAGNEDLPLFEDLQIAPERGRG